MHSAYNNNNIFINLESAIASSRV